MAHVRSHRQGIYPLYHGSEGGSMRVRVRVSLLALMVGGAVGVAVPAAAQAALTIERFVAADCSAGHETCGEAAAEKAATNELFTQAAGHPNFGITDFTIGTTAGVPNAVLTHIRTDVAPGPSTNPQATPKCALNEFLVEPPPPLEHSGLYVKNTCKTETVIGENKVTIFAGAAGDLSASGTVYNMVQPYGVSSRFGVSLKVPKALTEAKLGALLKGSDPPAEAEQYYAPTFIEGFVEWGTDYHDYFEIIVPTETPLISSRLIFNGRAGTGTFLTDPSGCNPPGPATTSTLTLTSEAGETVKRTSEAQVGAKECATVPFAPTFSVTPETTQLDEPDGLTAHLAPFAEVR